MFVINEDKSIHITRGDVAFFSIEAKTDTGETYKFLPGDVVRFKVFGKKDCENVVLSKDFAVEAEANEVSIYLEEKDTKFGDVISKPTDYWYEVELNPYTNPQTILGYDDDGAKVFKLFPEGNEAEDDDPITPEDIPVVDKELSLTSTRPVENQAIARAIIEMQEEVNKGLTNAKGNRITNVADPIVDNDAVNLHYAKEKLAVQCRFYMLNVPLDGTGVAPIGSTTSGLKCDETVIVAMHTGDSTHICTPVYDTVNHIWQVSIIDNTTKQPFEGGPIPLYVYYLPCDGSGFYE